MSAEVLQSQLEHCQRRNVKLVEVNRRLREANMHLRADLRELTASPSESTETQCDHLTPLEAVTKVIKDETERVYVRSMHNDRAEEIASAALLALAEAELPEATVDAASLALFQAEYSADHYTATPLELETMRPATIAAFRAMLRAIAGESK